MLIQTSKCVHCGNHGLLEVDDTQWARYAKGMLVQDAFPGMSADDREMLLTGTHPECAICCAQSVDCTVHESKDGIVIACPPIKKKQFNCP